METQLNELALDPSNFVGLCLDVLQNTGLAEYQDIAKNIVSYLDTAEPNILKVIDLQLMAIAGTEPWSFLVPTLRHHLGLTIQTDLACRNHLERLKELVTVPAGRAHIQALIDYLSEDKIHETKPIQIKEDTFRQLEDADKIKLLECLDYILELN